MVKAKYVAIYKFEGISTLANQQDLELGGCSDPVVKFRIVADPEPYSALIDQRTAVANIALNRLIGLKDERPLEVQLASNVETERTARQKRAGRGVFLIVDAEDANLRPDLKELHDYGRFAVVLDAIPLDYFTSLVREPLNQMLAAITLALPFNVSRRIDKIAEGTFIIDAGIGKPIFNMVLKMNAARLSLASPVSDSDVANIASLFTKLSNAADLHTPIRLLSQSLLTEEDDVRAFLAAWAALEIFVNKIFSSYESDWNGRLRRAVPPAGERYFDSVERIMKGKLNLMDKFSVIASILNPQGAANDFIELKAAKDARDEFFHALTKEPSRQASVDLFTKYLKLHVGLT